MLLVDLQNKNGFGGLVWGSCTIRALKSVCACTTTDSFFRCCTDNGALHEVLNVNSPTVQDVSFGIVSNL